MPVCGVTQGRSKGASQLDFEPAKIEEGLRFIEDVGDTVRMTGHLVHVIRHRAHDTIQLGQMFEDGFRQEGTLFATMGIKGAALGIGGNRLAFAPSPAFKLPKLRRRKKQVHTFRASLVFFLVVSLVGTAVGHGHKGRLKGSRGSAKHLPCLGLQGGNTPCQEGVFGKHFKGSEAIPKKCLLQICNLAQ